MLDTPTFFSVNILLDHSAANLLCVIERCHIAERHVIWGFPRPLMVGSQQLDFMISLTQQHYGRSDDGRKIENNSWTFRGELFQHLL